MLKIHFLNVGHGDCTIIEFPSGRTTMIDINNSKIVDEETKNEIASSNPFAYEIYKSLGNKGNILLEKSVADFVTPVDPIEYMEKHLPLSSIFRFILTHPDMDHMTGLYNLKHSGKVISNFWDTNNVKSVSKSEVSSIYDYRDWEVYQEMKSSAESLKTLNILKGEQNDYFNDDKIKILSPTQEIIDQANINKNWNLLSYVLLIEYAGHKIILGGDADSIVWDELAKSDQELLENVSILKASHHGRNSGYSENAAILMKPTWTICSVGKKPSQDAHNKYKKHTEKKVLSTRFRGNIVVEITEYGEMTVYCEDNHNAEEELYPLNN